MLIISMRIESFIGFTVLVLCRILFFGSILAHEKVLSCVIFGLGALVSLSGEIFLSVKELVFSGC